MKRGAVESPKVRRLSKRLKTGLATTVGHLELLWHFTSKQAPAGDVGRWADDEIADACDWEGDPTEFVDALVTARWLDPCPTFRLVVHDWHEHADDALRKAMRRRDASLRNVRWEDAEACFARPSAQIPESFRSSWREWQTTADNGGQRHPSADNGVHLPPSPPRPARPGPARPGEKRPPPSGGQRRALSDDDGEPLTDPTRTDLDADARHRPPDTAAAPQQPQTPPDADALKAAREVLDHWRDLRAAEAPSDRTVTPAAWPLKRDPLAMRLVPRVREKGRDALIRALDHGWQDRGDGKRWPGWHSKLATAEKVLIALAESELVDQAADAMSATPIRREQRDPRRGVGYGATAEQIAADAIKYAGGRASR